MSTYLKSLLLSVVVVAQIGGLPIRNANPTTDNKTYDVTVLPATLDSRATSSSKQHSLLPSAKPASAAKLAAPSSLSVKQPDLESWLDALAKRESGNREKLVHLDTNGKYSYGCLQFQKATFDGYKKKLLLPELDIMTCKDQRTLATAMLTANRNEWRHWYNVTQVIGLPPLL